MQQSITLTEKMHQFNYVKVELLDEAMLLE